MTQALALITSTRPVVEPLTKEQVKALKAANDSIVLFHNEEDLWTGAIVANIKSTLHGEDVRVRIEIPVNSSITNYEEGRASSNPLPDEELAQLRLRACYSIHWPSEPNGVWATIARQLRPGDQFHLRWVRGNYNQITRESGLAVDELSLLHLRASPGSTSRTIGTYVIGHSVGRKNCARMIRSERESRTY